MQDNDLEANVNLSADILQSLLQNTTISLLSLSNTNVAAELTQTPYHNVYSFSRRDKLIMPYAAVLIGTFFFLVIGIIALAQNGVAASGGGLLQLLCTTNGSHVLDEMVKGSCMHWWRRELEQRAERIEA